MYRITGHGCVEMGNSGTLRRPQPWQWSWKASQRRKSTRRMRQGSNRYLTRNQKVVLDWGYGRVEVSGAGWPGL
jgi:hypothetical protein